MDARLVRREKAERKDKGPSKEGLKRGKMGRRLKDWKQRGKCSNGVRGG